MKRIIGNIPEEIVFIYGGKQKIGNWWDDIVSKNISNELVTPAFISDSSNKKTMETGESWASYRCEKDDKVQKEILKNTPTEGFKIVGLEIRSQGGRAYKILTPNGYYVDLREDILMDTMLECGIDKGGILKGSFVWAKVGSQMKLVRVGSELHSALTENTKDNKLSPIPKSELEIGGIYKGKGINQFIYCGLVDTTVLKYVRTGRWLHEFTIEVKESKNAMLWYEPYSFSDCSTEKSFEESIKNGTSPWNFKVKTSCSVIKKIGSMKIPSDLVDTIRSIALNGYRSYSKDTFKDSSCNDKDLCSFSEMALIRRPGQFGLPMPIEYLKIMGTFYPYFSKKI